MSGRFFLATQNPEAPNELATRLGLKEQQIQCDEATDDASASLTRFCDVAVVSA